MSIAVRYQELVAKAARLAYKTDSMLRILIIMVLCLSATTAVAQHHTVQLDKIQPAKEQPYSLSSELYYLIENDEKFNPAELLIETHRQYWQQARDEFATVGNSTNPVWFYLDFFSGNTALNSAYIQIRHSSLNSVSITIFRDGELIDTRQINNSQAFSSREISQPTIIFPLVIEAQRRYQILFRVESTTFIDFPLYLHSPESLINISSQRNFYEGLYYGMVILMVLYNLFIFLSTRDISYLFYICFISSIALIIASIEGIGYQYIWPNHPQINDYSVALFASSSILFGALFTTTFLGIWRKNNWLSRYYKLLIFGSAASMVLSLSRQADFSLELASALALIAYPGFLITGLFSWREGHHYARYFTIAWMALCIFVILLSITALGIVNIAIDNLWPLIRYGSSIEMVLLSLALAAKINDIKSRERIARNESAAKSNYIAQLSHELRTPMNGVLGMSQLLNDRLKDDTSRHYNKVIYQSGLALLGVVNDVLDAAKIDADKLEIEEIPFDLHALMQETLCVIEPQALEKAIQLSCQIDASIPQWVVGDPNRIKQIVFNFLSNASKFTENGKIELSVQPGKTSNLIHISVSDTGIGIADEKLNELFHPYSQASSSTARRYGGTGLGLYICQRLTHLMKGEITVNNNQPHGSIFSVILPLPEGMPPQEIKPALSTRANNASYNILVAEDNQINQTIIKKMLEKLGHHVTVANNGLEAVEQLKNQRFDLVLMDCEMPEMDGYEATRKIRETEQPQQLAHTPIIAVTAHALKSYRDQALESGMDDLVTKPLKLEILQQSIAAYAQVSTGHSNSKE